MYQYSPYGGLKMNSNFIYKSMYKNDFLNQKPIPAMSQNLDSRFYTHGLRTGKVDYSTAYNVSLYLN